MRVFLGYKWLNEGLKKIMTGWLDPGAGGFFEPDPANIYLPGIDFSATSGDSGATPSGDKAAAGGGETDWGEPILDEALGIYDWFAATILELHPLVAFLSQAGVVLAQVVIGVFLIVGLFTVPAAIVSILLGIMFIISGWGNVELWWYLAASIVMLGGAGKGFGLDHTVMPALKRWWNGTRVAKKSYLYLDEPRL